MGQKILHQDLHIGGRGEGHALRLYGPGSEIGSFVQIQAPTTDFSPVIYTLPVNPEPCALLQCDAEKNLFWSPGVIKFAAISQVGRLGADLPPGYAITGIIAENHSGTPGQVTFSSTPLGNDIYGCFPVDTNGVSCRQTLFISSLTQSTPLYVNIVEPGDSINGTVADIYFLIHKIA